MNGEQRQVYEVLFSRGRSIRYLSHLDLMRTWERMIRRARLPIAVSEGFNPRPRLNFAAPLPVGVMSRGDLLELILLEDLPVKEVAVSLERQAVPGLEIEAVARLRGKRKSLAARLREALYEIRVPDAAGRDYAAAAQAVLAAQRLPMRQDRRGQMREYDFRPLVLELSYHPDPNPLFQARLRHDPQATGRPGDLVTALGLDPAEAEITRVGLVLQPES